MRRLLMLRLLSALCFCASVNAGTKQNAQKPPPGRDELLQLNKGNFNAELKKHKQLLVHFYSPLSGEGHRLSALFEGAAEGLQGSEVKAAVLDVSKEKDLAEELNATGLPTIKLYLSGDKYNPKVCPVPQSSNAILTWLKRRAGSAADLIADLSQSEASEELTVVGFFKDLNHEYVQVYYAAALSLPDVNFAITQDDEVISKYGQTHDVILLLKKSKLIRAYKMMPQTSKEQLVVFITVYQMDPVTEYTGKTAPQILSSPVLSHALLFISRTSGDFERIHSAFSSTAQTFRMKILFVWVNVDEPRNGRLMEYFRVRDYEAPVVRMVNLTDHVTYHLPSDTLDLETITGFCRSYLEGKAKAKMQSEPPPEGWDEQPVKELVGMNLEQVAFNPHRTVFVMFYLPYSQASRSLFPLWEELAEATKERQDVVIARIDASANDINMSTQGAYPSLCLFPALYAERVVVYSGERNLQDLMKFLDQEMEKAKKDRAVEDADRRKYSEAMKAEEAKKGSQSKNEL